MQQFFWVWVQGYLWQPGLKGPTSERKVDIRDKHKKTEIWRE